MYLNRGQVLGNITADAELKQTKEQKPYITFTIATNYKKPNGGEEVVDFHYVVLYGSIATTLLPSLKKGVKVFCEGRMQTSKYRKTEQDSWSYKHSILCDKIILCHKKEYKTPATEDNLFFQDM